ncbi:MAG TPA: hypothetical protein VLW55_22380 [Burkholderiaceae bacterium]|nr:hypothetical protein [Burkholderiaceae bacterium]
MNDSSYWGPPRHDLPMTHALPNATDSYRDPGIGGGAADWTAPANVSAPIRTGGAVSVGAAVQVGGPVSGPAAALLAVVNRRSIPLAALLAFLFGPLGLFYVGLLHGIAALIVLPIVVRSLALAIASVLHGGMNTVYAVAVPILWCFAIPWAIIGMKMRNARMDRAAARVAR